ncbi:MAG: MBG domain-containing protein [Chthoniobacterales bacterium]
MTFGNLTQSYTGSPLTPTVTTVPAGLAVILTGVPQTNAGSYPVTARVNDSVYQGSAGAVFVINKASATVTLGNLTQTYTGSPLAPTVTTVPAGLNVIVTGGPQTNAGSYPFTATISEANYQGSGTGTFVINKATPTVTIANLQQTYTGSPLSPTVTTLPAGLKVIVTGFPQTNAGFYPVTAAVNDPNYLPGSVTDSFLIDKALAVFVWDHLIQTYTGTPLSPGVTTIPAGLTVVITGTPLPQVNAGSYPITGTINDLNYRGVSPASFFIQPAPATVTLSNLTQTFTGSPLSPTVTTVPAGVSFKFFNGAPQTNAGVYPVTAGVTNPNYITASGTGGGTFRINKASVPVTLKATPLYFANGTWSSTNPKPASCASVSGICQAYSDQMKFTVTLPAFAGTDSENVLTPVPCATASGTVIAPCVNVAVGGQTYGPVALTSAGSTLTGTITPALVNGPGAYSFGAVTPVAGSNPNLSLTTSNASDHFTVVAEDALLTYTGLTDFTTAPNVTAQNIAVSYTVQDPSAVNSSNPNYDPSSGNIQLARFTFTLTGTSPSGPVTRSCSTGSGSLVSTGAGTVTAQCVINSVPTNGSYTLTATAQSFPLPDGSVAPYIPAGGDVSVAIKNGNDGVGSIKGDGAQTAEYLASSQPAQGKYPAFGLLTPAPGTKVKFDFKGDYQKKGIDAKATIEIQAMAQTTDPEGNAKPKKELHTYRIEADQIESLTIEPPLELWVSTAKITDATDHNKVVSTNAQLQMVMHAVAEGKEGKGDKPSLSIQVSDDTNGLWFSNNWTGVNTAVSETTPQIQEGMITFKEK